MTVTHRDIIRYFMTIPEAVRLVLQAAAIGESGQVLVLDMGEPVKIVELAREMVRLAGHRDDEIAIEFSGLRAGEKLYEELLADKEATVPTRIDRLRIARLTDSGAAVRDFLGCVTGDPPRNGVPVHTRLQDLLPEYRTAKRKITLHSDRAPIKMQ